MTSARLLFIKTALAWPGASGHDVHTLQTARALAGLGHEVALATRQPLADTARAALKGVDLHVLADQTPAPLPRALTRSQERFRSYWGVDLKWLERVSALVRAVRPDAVVSVGLDALPYLAAVPDGTVRVWYAADEWVRHHLSLVSIRDRSTWPHVKAAVTKGLYERAYASLVDVAWVVSKEEQRAANRWAGMSADIVPNGVDTDTFRPTGETTLPDTAVFWGTLDFEPNLQALEWFLDNVWPRVLALRPSARFTIVGLRPTPAAVAMGNREGVELIANAPDVRPLVSQRQVAVLPFVSGGGIKNKLLEAAALGLPIVVTPKGIEGLVGVSESALEVHSAPDAFAYAIRTLWDSPNSPGSANRSWVVTHHSWASAAFAAQESIERYRAGRIG